MSSRITQDEFNRLLATFGRSAFRLETQPAYALGYERADFDRFLAGAPVPPPELDWWRPWLDQIASLTGEGKTVSRVRVLTEPPTDYQRWEVWGARWNAEAGERVGYMRQSHAERIGLPLDHDWWLLDDERLIIMRYNSVGEIDIKELTTDPGTVAQHRDWRDLAVRNATTAEEIAAA
jgi:hypothetical protein